MAVSGSVESALPLWKGMRFAIVAITVVALAIVTQCRDRYPIVAEVPGGCAPCVCSDGVLMGCPFHAEMNDPFIFVNGRGLRAVETGAFRGNKAALSINLHDNELVTLPDGVFDDLGNAYILRLDNNQLSSLSAGVFDKLSMVRSILLSNNEGLTELPPALFDDVGSLSSLDLRYTGIEKIENGTFRGAKELRSLDISNTNISHPIRKTTFAHNAKLAYLSLAGNPFTTIEAGALDAIQHVWLTGSNLTCAEALLGDAGCTDDRICSAIHGITFLGDGLCDSYFDPKYSSAECLWDGGDCVVSM